MSASAGLLAANRGRLDRAYLGSWMDRTLDDAVAQELREMLRHAGTE